MCDLANLYWEASKETSGGVSKEVFLKHLQNFALRPIIVGNKTVGCIATRGNEIHVGVAPEARGRWCGKWFLRLLNSMVKQYGEVVTYAFAAQQNAIKFILGLGFCKVDESNGVFVFVLRR